MNPTEEVNVLLRALPDDERANLLRSGTELCCESGSVLYTPGAPMDAIYFPRSSVVSVTIEFAEGRLVESATIGREGVCGLPLLLGSARSRQRVICQVPG